MDKITKEFVDTINKRIAYDAAEIQRMPFTGNDNEIVVNHITKYIEDIQELLAVRTKLLK